MDCLRDSGVLDADPTLENVDEHIEKAKIGIFHLMTEFRGFMSIQREGM